VPLLVHRGLAAVRAYGPHVAVPEVPLERLHSLRIASKGLRYTLEFFQEILGPEAKGAIQRIKGLQDHLGELQDAVVACTLLRDFLIWGRWGEPARAPQEHPAEPIIAPGVASYLAVRQADLQRLVAGFPEVWQTVSGPEFSRLVLSALAPLA
jgi:CHAD domain-containing protein